MIWIGTVVFAFVCWRGGLLYALSVLDRRAAARGWPADYEALNGSYRLPAGQENAAEYILSAGAAFKAQEEACHMEVEVAESDELTDQLGLLLARHEAGEIDEAEYERERQFLNEALDASTAAENARLEELMALAHDNAKALDEFLEDPPIDYLRDDLPEGAPPLPDTWRTEIEAVLARREHLLPDIEKAAAIGAARYPVDFKMWPDSTGDMMDAWMPLSTGASLLQRSAVLHAEDGRSGDAVNDLVAVFRLAQTLEREPTVMSQLVWSAIVSKGLKGLAHVLSRCQLESSQLNALSVCLGRACEHDIFTVAWAGERCLVRPGFDVRDVRPENDAVQSWEDMQNLLTSHIGSSDDDLEFFGDDDPKRPAAGNWRYVYEIPYKIAGLETLDCVLFMWTLEKALAVSTRSPVQKAKWLRKNFWRVQRHVSGLLNSRRFGTTPETFLITTFFIKTRLTTAQTALAVERFRLKHGTLPASLSELPEASPIDFFSGEPLRYRRMQDGYTIYSIGPDAIHGGPKRGTVDFVFIVTRDCST